LAQKTERVLSYHVWRNLVLERDGYACRECRSTEHLHTHHIKQVAFFPELRTVVSNGATLCEDCHRLIKSKKPARRRQCNQRPIVGERWRAVVGYQGLYSVSNRARVRRDKSGAGATVGRILNAVPIGPYLHVTLYNGKRKLTKKVHALVAAAFIGPRPQGMLINHIDTVRTNNVPRNLEYLTPAGNIAHMFKLGRAATGDRSGARRNPDRVARGDRHSSRTHPERVPRGDAHHSRRRPERMARGDRHGTRTCPETVRRGVDNGNSKITEADVRAIRSGGTDIENAKRYGLNRSTAGRIRRREIWKHI